jgi:two-component system alkaline phosphatase synthesis response regulator PhoP
MDNKKVLIVEDEESVARVLKDKLKNNGVEAEYVLNAKDGLEKILKENFDLIILDLILPEMDGFQFMEELRKRNILVPVVVTSNLSSEEEISKAKNLGAKEYFVKVETPIDKVVDYVKNALLG